MSLIFFFYHLRVDTPPYTIFVVSGIQLDDASTETRLLLRNASLATSGRYKCEVSGGPPRSVQYSTVQYSTGPPRCAVTSVTATLHAHD